MDLNKAIRFQVIVNGDIVTTAGLDEFGTLSTLLSRTLRPSDPLDDDVAVEAVSLNVAALHGAGHEYLTWFNGPLKRGDEVTIRILGDGDIDDPASRRHLEREPRNLVHLSNVLRDLEPVVEACADGWLPDTNEHFITFNTILDDLESDFPTLAKTSRFDTEGARANELLARVRAVRVAVEAGAAA